MCPHLTFPKGMEAWALVFGFSFFLDWVCAISAGCLGFTTSLCGCSRWMALALERKWLGSDYGYCSGQRWYVVVEQLSELHLG